jgi:tetratricopeptide (TPR) repeat protein
MKRKIHILFFQAVLIFLFAAPGISQESGLKIYGTKGDSVNCGVYLSGYREFFKIKLYDLAREPWTKAFDNCPASSERMYLDGVTLYRSYIEEEPDGLAREGMIDTLMLIYDRRMENFGDEGNVLGRKGNDLLTYRGEDIEEVEKAYIMLKKSIEIEGSKSQESVMLLYMSAGIALNKEGKLDDNQVIEDYIMLSGMLEQLQKSSSRWERTIAKMDEIVFREGILSCESLNRFYETQFEQNKNDRNYLEKLVALYTVSGCNRSDIYVAASENLYRINPGPELAHELGILFITRNDFEKASAYLGEALQGENIAPETRSEWYYELALVSLALEENCEAIAYAREAIGLRNDFSAAIILLGDAFIASRSNLGDEFQQRTAYWAAADQYREAARVDPSVEEETRQKLDESSGRYPDSEETFFRDLKEGSPYQVGGCINVNTTVRTRK